MYVCIYETFRPMSSYTVACIIIPMAPIVHRLKIIGMWLVLFHRGWGVFGLGLGKR